MQRTSTPRRYAVAVLVALMGAGVRWLLEPILANNAPFTTFYVAVFAVTYYCGSGPGTLAAVLGALLADFFFIPPLFSLSFYVHHPHDSVWLFLYLLGCAVAIVFIEALRKARAAAETARLRLQQSEERYRDTFQYASMGIAHVDLDGAFLWVNPRIVEITGYSEAELVSRKFREITHPDDIQADLDLVRRVLAGEMDTYRREKRYIRKDGGIAWVAVCGRLVRTRAGAPDHFVAAVEDITERKALEDQVRLKQRFESLGLLAGGLAHDINNLMTVVSGNCSIALEDPDNAASAQYLRAAVRAAERASRLTGQLLAYAGKAPFFPRELDVNELISASLHLLRSAVPDACELRVQLEADLPLVHGDAAQIQEVIANLVLNAAEACADKQCGIIGLRTSVGPLGGTLLDAGPSDPARTEYVEIEVSDNGGGMDPTIRAKIFDPFFSTKFTGRGLGLAAVAGIVRSHRGGIRVDSTAGEGSTFAVFLPGLKDSSARSRRNDAAIA